MRQPQRSPRRRKRTLGLAHILDEQARFDLVLDTYFPDQAPPKKTRLGSLSLRPAHSNERPRPRRASCGTVSRDRGLRARLLSDRQNRGLARRRRSPPQFGPLGYMLDLGRLELQVRRRSRRLRLPATTI